jgi:GntR family transcriptional repressor for pyruvate dehydrogenase complex
LNPYFKQLKKRSLYEDIAGQILGLIAGGQYGRGDRLPGEREMAELLGVNRSTLREALRVLEFMRVIEKKVGEGIFVTADDTNFGLETVVFRFMSEDGLDVHSLTDAYNAITVIEGVMAELAARRISPEELGHLEELLGKMEQAVNTGESFTALDKEFHLALDGASKSPVLMGIASTIWVMLERYAVILFGAGDAREKCGRDHARIVGALAQGRDKECRRLVEDHFRWARQALFDHQDI